MKDHGYDYLVKLLIIGDSGVGKTNILLRGCDNKFIPSHLMTIGNGFIPNFFKKFFYIYKYYLINIILIILSFIILIF